MPFQGTIFNLDEECSVAARNAVIDGWSLGRYGKPNAWMGSTTKLCQGFEEVNFGAAELGDERRANRLVKLVKHPPRSARLSQMCHAAAVRLPQTAERLNEPQSLSGTLMGCPTKRAMLERRSRKWTCPILDTLAHHPADFETRPPSPPPTAAVLASTSRDL